MRIFFVEIGVGMVGRKSGFLQKQIKFFAKNLEGMISEGLRHPD